MQEYVNCAWLVREQMMEETAGDPAGSAIEEDLHVGFVIGGILLVGTAVG
jgi:hypothetical protein